MKKAVLIYADFMKCDHNGRLILTCLGTHKDLTKNNITLQEGIKLVFYNDDANDEGNEDDLIVEGIVEYDKENDRWIAKSLFGNSEKVSGNG